MANIDFQNGFINGFVAGSTNIDVNAINKRDTEANWISNNPVLLNGEQVIVDIPPNTIRIKVGDGITNFVDLPYTDENILESLESFNSTIDTKFMSIDNSIDSIESEVETLEGDLTSHTTSSNAQFALIREEFANADTETLKSAKEYSDANKNSAVSEAKAYTNQEIEKLVTDTEFEGVLSTIQDIQNAMATDEELAQALETANGKKVDKGAKGSAIQPIYFDDNGAQPIAYTIEKSVPADAKFTDTTYTLIKDATNKKIQLMNGETLVSEVDDNNTTYTIDSSLSTSSTNPIQNKVVAENINSLQEDIDANASEIEEINSKDLFETKHEEGNAIAVSDSAEAPFVGMKLYGKTTQDGIPTPDAPIDLVSVGDSGSFEIGVYGGNLIDEQALVRETSVGADYVRWENGKLHFVNSDGANFASNTAEVKLPIGTYYLKANFTENASISYIGILRLNGVVSYFGNNVKILEITEPTTLQIQLTTNNMTTICDYKCNIMLSVVKDCPYEPYKAKQTLTMPYELPSVTDIQDEIDFVKGVRFNKVGIYKSLISNADLTANGGGLFSINGISNFKTLAKISCNMFVMGDTRTTNNTIATDRGDYNRPYFRCNGFETVDAFKSAYGDKEIVIHYELATPIETPMTETELNTYRQLHANKPNTTILSKVDMEVDYVVDSTSADYIENRLEEVEDKIPTKTSQLIFDEEVVNSTSDVVKIVPEGSGKYAAVNKVGGMSYKSSNLLEYPYAETTKSTSGLNFKDNGDGSLTITGTTTGAAGFNLIMNPILLGGKRYFVGIEGSGTGYENVLIYLMYKETADSASKYCSTSMTWNSSYIVNKVYLQIEAGKTLNCTIRPKLTVDSEKPYEAPYTGIRNAAVTKVIAAGKNLLNVPQEITAVAKGYYFKDLPVNLSEGKYTFSFVSNYNLTGNEQFIVSASNNGTVINPVPYTNANTVKELHFTIEKSGEYLFTFFTAIGGTITNFQLEIGAEATEYESYKENVLEIPTNVIATADYGLGVNENYYNYIDFERKVFVKRCKKVSGLFFNGTNTNTKVFIAHASGFIGGGEGSNNALCSHIDIYGFHAQDSPHFYIDNNWNTINVYLPISVDDSVASEIEVIAVLATPEEIDISDYLPDDNFLEVATGGVITVVNKYNYDAPTEISFFTSENPEKVIVVDKIVGDLVGVAEEAQSLTGLESTPKELNYLHKNTIEEEGWLVPETGDFELDGMCGAVGLLGLKIGNTYTFTITYKDGTIKTDSVEAIDGAERDFASGIVIVQSAYNQDIIIIDNANVDSDFNVIIGGNHYWYPPSILDTDIESILITGTKADNSVLSHIVEVYNKIPMEHLPDEITTPPIIQEWEWTDSDTGEISSGIEFQKPEGYNRCEIFAFDRKLKSSGSATIYGTTIVPMCNEDGNTWFDCVDIGETPAKAKMGRGMGTTTTGGTEWVTTLKGECSFLEQGYIFTYHYGAAIIKIIDITSTEDAPPTFTGQLSCIIRSDSDKTSILDSSLQWYFFALPEQNKGNYIKIVWYKD